MSSSDGLLAVVRSCKLGTRANIGGHEHWSPVASHVSAHNLFANSANSNIEATLHRLASGSARPSQDCSFTLLRRPWHPMADH